MSADVALASETYAGDEWEYKWKIIRVKWFNSLNCFIMHYDTRFFIIIVFESIIRSEDDDGSLFFAPVTRRLQTFFIEL
jgi:hypothetical protein